MIRRSGVVFLLVVALSSCAPKRSEILLNTDATPPDVLLKAVEEKSATLSSLIGNGVVSFDSPEISGSASFESNMKKPDSLLVTLAGPFGIEVGTFFLSKEKYIMYNSFENSVTTGNPNSSSIRSIIPFDLTSEQLLNAFAGVFNVRQTEGDLQKYAIEDEMFLLTYTCGANTCKYWIDSRYVLVTHFEQRDSNDNLLIDAKASAFVEEDKVAVARRIQIKFPKQGRQISIVYKSLKLNTADTDFHFTIPSTAQQIVR